jgi:hypothetical protein|tara:strand:+ start:1981 stop:2205 length:225 start_codon:yes stop_codon:yes gene_type:complete
VEQEKVVLSVTAAHGSGCHQQHILQAVTEVLEAIALENVAVGLADTHIGQEAAALVQPNIVVLILIVAHRALAV